LNEIQAVVHGKLEGPVMIDLNGVKLEVDLLGGHKTGYYLDQQVNYASVSRFAKGANVLDAFCFIGGFAIHAARGGAARVHGLDQSGDAVASAARNAEANGMGPSCSFEATNVFDWLKAQTTAAPNEKVVPRYDLIILDPPSFTKNRASVGDALRGYKEIHLRALKLLKRSGVLATFCCSHHVDANTFQQVILEAAFDARRVLRKIESYSQSPDHPVVPTIPETEYLKGFAFEIAR
jgi:23S rRNA (cytosine1962-C5)-methyltransferase